MHWNTLASIYKARNNLTLAIEILHDILPDMMKYCVKLTRKQQSVNLAMVYHNLAECYNDDLPRAQEYAEKAVDVFDRLRKYDHAFYPIVLTGLATVKYEY